MNARNRVSFALVSGWILSFAASAVEPSAFEEGNGWRLRPLRYEFDAQLDELLERERAAALQRVQDIETECACVAESLAHPRADISGKALGPEVDDEVPAFGYFAYALFAAVAGLCGCVARITSAPGATPSWLRAPHPGASLSRLA